MYLRPIVMILLFTGIISCSGKAPADSSTENETEIQAVPAADSALPAQETENPEVSRKELRPDEVPPAVKKNLPKMFPNRVVINRAFLITYADGTSLYMFAIEHEGKRLKVLFDEQGMFKGELKPSS